jgi:hypothetical protein
MKLNSLIRLKPHLALPHATVFTLLPSVAVAVAESESTVHYAAHYFC